MSETTTLVELPQPRTDVPDGVAERRYHHLDLFRVNLRDCYRRLVDRRVGEELATRPSGTRCTLQQAFTDIEASLAKLPRQAVLANIIISASSDTRRQEIEEAERALIKEKLLPTFSPYTLLHDADVPMCITPAQLREQTAYTQARDAVVDGLVTDVTQFLENGLLGRVIRDPDAPANHGAYSFVLRRVQETVHTSSTPWKETVHDANAPLGERRTFTFERTTDRHHRERHLTEEHVHYLENQSLSPFETYTKKLPPWAQQLRKTIPDWVAPELQVVEGTIVREETSILNDYSREWATTIVEVWKMSPAIVLGDLVLTGWSDEDLDSGIPRWVLWGGIGTLGLLTLLIPGVAPVVGRVVLLTGKWVGRAAART